MGEGAEDSSHACVQRGLAMRENAQDGVLFLGDEEVPRADLTESLRAELEQTDDKVVILRADTHVEHGEVVRVMDLIRDAGAEGMTIDARAGAAN